MLSGDILLQAACRNRDPDALFVQGAEQNIAKKICRPCPLKYECLADALDNRTEFGVWGGMTERERRAILRRHPHVASWKQMLEVAGASKEELISAAGSAALKNQALTPENVVPATEPAAPETLPIQEPAGSNVSDSSRVVAPTFHIQPGNPVI